MIDNYLSWSDGVVTLGGKALPGILVSLRISSGVRYDRAYKDHQSGKMKTPLGWEDADVKLVMDLDCDQVGTCYDKLTEIDNAFKSAGDSKAPRVYDVDSTHLRARGVKKVVFSGLESEETNQDDVIQATLSFSEHIPVVVKREQAVAAKKPASAPAVKTKPAAAPTVQADTVNPLIAGLNSGLGR